MGNTLTEAEKPHKDLHPHHSTEKEKALILFSFWQF